MRSAIVGSLASSVLALSFLAMPESRTSAQEPSVTSAQQPASNANPAFAIVSVRPSPDTEADDWGIGIRGRNFWAVHVTTDELISWAYGISPRQIEHAPEWFATERFDIQGLPDPGIDPPRDQYRTMLQAALAERFGLKFHSAQKVLPVYVLSVANGGLKIPKSADQNAKPSWGVHRGWLSIKCMTLGDAARVMQRTIFDRPVLDHTGLNDRYTFILKWRADETQFTQMQGVEVPEETGTDDVEDIFTSARQQLGLKIEARKEPAPTIVIEAVSHSSQN